MWGSWLTCRVRRGGTAVVVVVVGWSGWVAVVGGMMISSGRTVMVLGIFWNKLKEFGD